MVFGDQITFQLVALKQVDTSSSDILDEKPMYETQVIAEKVIQVHKLIYNNMQSMSVDLKHKMDAAASQKNDESQSRVDGQTEDSTLAKGNKLGSIKFKISFMRGKFFNEKEVSKVLYT